MKSRVLKFAGIVSAVLLSSAILQAKPVGQTPQQTQLIKNYQQTGPAGSVPDVGASALLLSLAGASVFAYRKFRK